MAWKTLLDDARWNHRDDPARADELVGRAIRSAEAETEAAERVRAFESIADYLDGRERWAEASMVYGRLIDLLRKNHASQDELAARLARHAEIESSAGDLESAAKLLEEALSLWRESSRSTLERGAAWYEQLAEARSAAARHIAASAARSRATELRIEASGEYYQPRVMRHARGDGTVEYAVHDVYFSLYGDVKGYTQHARSPRMPSVATLQKWLEETLPVAATGVACGDLGYMHYAPDLTQWLRHIHEEPLDYERDPEDEAWLARQTG
ncbi:hypothetical protein predicted by Glimmer/Critica [Sorangium cellulosum So ce56]|uniref:Tetratricopeptide repeat protein n=1 Tax=Sorangium cellulosum (strain So ce56) TaxID=448385 RepID=A9FXV8_SORC5|nr:hypothetical protein [Sorangium cellulosum]CAN95554.1 hypothetical protein predicted by Glimmer/Critica [Sorangium cellulosum So ce56]